MLENTISCLLGVLIIERFKKSIENTGTVNSPGVENYYNTKRVEVELVGIPTLRIFVARNCYIRKLFKAPKSIILL